MKVSLQSMASTPERRERAGGQVTDWKAVGRRIRERREAMGQTQEQLGATVGSSANYVAQVEKGLPISEKKLALYSVALGMSMPLLRYNVAQGEDVEQIRAIAVREAHDAVLVRIRAWIDQFETDIDLDGLLREREAHTKGKTAVHDLRTLPGPGVPEELKKPVYLTKASSRRKAPSRAKAPKSRSKKAS